MGGETVVESVGELVEQGLNSRVRGVEAALEPSVVIVRRKMIQDLDNPPQIVPRGSELWNHRSS